MTELRALHDARMFRPGIPFGEELAGVHVPFDELTGHHRYEARVRSVADSGGLLLVVGGTGCGKSGLTSWALSMADGRLAVPVPVSVPHPDGAGPKLIPTLVLDGLANVLLLLDEQAAEVARLAGEGRRPPSRLARTELNVKGLAFNLGSHLRDRPLMAREQRDEIHQAMAALRAGGLRPVMVLDDTDKWATTDDRLRAARHFFDSAIGALVDLDLAVVAHAHPRYFETTRGSDIFDAGIHIPRLDAAGIRTVLAHRVRVATDDSLSLDAVMSDDAVDRICRAYVEDSTTSVRRLIQVASEALVQAVEAGATRVEVGAVENALTVF